MENFADWAAAVVLAALFLVFAIHNGRHAWAHHVRKKHAPSLMPIAGGVFGFLAVLALPLGTLPARLWFAWIPLLADVSIPITAIALWRDVRRGK